MIQTNEIPKNFDYTLKEAEIRKRWENSGIYKAGNQKKEKSKPFSILMPPPNVTGILHFGHVLNHTLQDIYIRRHRMLGDDVCWFPGLDHAGIATQTRVEKELAKDGITKYDIGREAFLDKVWEWKDKYGGIIIDQLNRLGNSSSWDKLLFTMDDSAYKAVQKVFVDLYNEGLIYRGKRIINWSPLSMTALSDEEVDFKEVNGKFYTLKYKFPDSDDYILVGTVRPETLFGDVAIAVNPNDEKYKSVIGKKVIVPIVNREIPIIEDDYADPDFGTGCVKVTPAHDPNDYEIGIRHSLEMINTINPDGSMNEKAVVLEGLDRFEARKKMIELIENEGLVHEIKDYVHNVGFSQRGGEQIEPYLSDQWFVYMKPLAEIAIGPIESGEIKFHPSHWEKTYKHWMNNIKDWCISRQLWWGHRIPVYYDENGNHTAALSERDARENLGLSESDYIHQDPDVLDTWFSSWLWPMTTMGWNGEEFDSLEDGKVLPKYLPTNLLVTGPDIIFFWVARMVMASKKFAKSIPFTDVYFTSMIRDGQGKKLSKSLGNSPDPLNIFDKYGVDAVRFTMIYLAPLGQDVRMDVDVDQQDIPSMEIGRNFVNKLWNAARFILMKKGEGDGTTTLDSISINEINNLDIEDKWILSRLNETIESVNQSLTSYSVNEYSKTLYEFVWSEFCGWYIECFKVRYFANSDNAKKVQFAEYILIQIVKLLHPVVPYITEEIWDLTTQGKKGVLANTDNPEIIPLSIDNNDILNFDLIKQTIEEIRKVRSLVPAISPGQKVPVFVISNNESQKTILESELDLIQRIAKAESISFVNSKPENSISTVSLIGEIGVIVESLIDIGEEKNRIEQEIKRIEGQLIGIDKKLSNERFVNNAPKEVVDLEKKKQSDMSQKIEQLKLSLKSFA